MTHSSARLRIALGRPVRIAAALMLSSAFVASAPAQVSTITVDGGTPGLTQGTMAGGASSLFQVAGLTGGSTTRGFVSVFYVPTATGTFTFGQTSAPFDSVMFLATGVFNPASPGTGVSVLNDDSDGAGIPGVTMGT